jgi:hypothetical protein
VAGFVQGLSGFAFGMVAMSFWAWVLEPQLAAVLSVFGSLTGRSLRPSPCGANFTGSRCCPSSLADWSAFPWAWP